LLWSRPKSITALSIATLTDQVTISTVATAVLGVMVTEKVADPEVPLPPVPEDAPPEPVAEPPLPPVPSALPGDLQAAGDNARETMRRLRQVARGRRRTNVMRSALLG
jgi:hypothetical protein